MAASSQASCWNRRWRRERVDFVVIGIGVNIHSAPRDTEYPATSLAAEGVAGVAPEALLAAFTRDFERWARRWRDEGFAGPSGMAGARDGAWRKHSRAPRAQHALRPLSRSRR